MVDVILFCLHARFFRWLCYLLIEKLSAQKLKMFPSSLIQSTVKGRGANSRNIKLWMDVCAKIQRRPCSSVVAWGMVHKLKQIHLLRSPVFQCSYSKVQCIARLFSGMVSRYNKALVKKEYFSFFSFSVFQIQIFLGLCCKLSKNNLLEKMGKKKRHYYWDKREQT